jgi:type IV pilus assembly protein PilQ
MVAPAPEIAARERQEIETNKQLQELAPLQTEYIRILYANATDIFALFQSSSGDSGADSTGSILSPRGQVIVDERTNSLLVTETPQKIEEVRRLIRLIDVPVRQVLIESRIVVANSDFSQDLGIKWGGALKSNSDLSEASSLATGSLNANIAARNDGVLQFPDALVVDLGVQKAGATSFAVDFVNDRLDLTAELSALESNGEGEVVSQPKVITGDKQQATIKSGQQVPYLESSSSGRTTVKFKDAVLKLDVTPNITPDDRIIMDLIINQDEVGGFINGEFNSQIPIIDTTELVTQVLVDNGETIVLGGVFQLQDITNITKTPYLGDIPYLGRLFRRTSQQKEKTETLIFITPRILSDNLLD